MHNTERYAEFFILNFVNILELNDKLYYLLLKHRLFLFSHQLKKQPFSHFSVNSFIYFLNLDVEWIVVDRKSISCLYVRILHCKKFLQCQIGCLIDW